MGGLGLAETMPAPITPSVSDFAGELDEAAEACLTDQLRALRARAEGVGPPDRPRAALPGLRPAQCGCGAHLGHGAVRTRVEKVARRCPHFGWRHERQEAAPALAGPAAARPRRAGRVRQVRQRPMLGRGARRGGGEHAGRREAGALPLAAGAAHPGIFRSKRKRGMGSAGFEQRAENAAHDGLPGFGAQLPRHRFCEGFRDGIGFAR